MKKIGVCTDSHSGITRDEAARLDVRVLPMPFYIGENCYFEDVSISRAAFLEKLAAGAEVSTSQPSPASVMGFWDRALAEFEQIVYIPISSGLSGSCAAAQALAMEEKYEGKVFVVDNGRVSAPQHRAVLDALELIAEGYSAAEVKKILEDARAEMAIYIGVETLQYLKKGGRISPATAALGTVLNIKPVLKLDVGTLDTFQKCRGFGKAKKVMLEAVRQDLETRWKEYHDRGEVYLLVASSASPEATEEWVREIRQEFPDMEALCDELSLGVSCHIGPGGLGIACSCRPKRP